MTPLLRSVLYIPGSNDRALAKAGTLAADALILDLEDSVAPEAKSRARQAIVEALATLAGQRMVRAVRINPVGSSHWQEDLQTVLPGQPDALVIPKVEDVDQVREVAALLPGEKQPFLWPMIESPLAVLQAHAIARHPRVTCLVMGTADLAKGLRLRNLAAGRQALRFALQHALLAARAAGVAILDGVYGQFRDEAGFRAQCQEGADLGFDGKTLIHPSQVAVANQLFLPDDETMRHARRLVAAWQEARARGEEICVVDGHMVERLHAQDAERLIALWDQAHAS